MAQIHSPHPKVPFLGMNSKKPLPKRSRRTRPYPKQSPSPGEILARGKPAAQARIVGERTSFFEGALLPGTETGRAGVFSRTTHHDQRRTILPRAAPTTARATSNRVRSRSPCSTDPSSQHGKPSTRSHRPVLKERVSQPGEDIIEAALVPARDSGGSPPGCPPSTASLSSPGTSQDSCHQARLLVRGGGETVGDQHFLLQGQATSSYSVGSDASNQRWDTNSQGISTTGPWTPQEGVHHSNYIKLLAAFLALKSFTATLRSEEYHFHTSPGRPLFIAVRKPHKPVTAATIGCWLRSIMSSAGTLCGY